MHYNVFSRLPLEERIGLAMKHSGVAITITSVTDLLAFGIGATSVLPALGNFCAYASLGIFAVFFNMASFFLAWLVIDQRRIDARRDGLFCCWKKGEDWTPNECSQKSYMDLIFTKYAGVIHQVPLKIAILVISAVILAVSCYGVSQLESNFDFVDWFPQDSAVVEYFKASEKHFSSGGISGKIYVAEVPKIEEKLEKLDSLVANVGNVSDLSGNGIRSFLPSFFKHLNGVKKLTSQEFRTYLKTFLCGASGFSWKNNILFVGGEKLNCLSGEDQTPEVRTMTFGYQHQRLAILDL